MQEYEKHIVQIKMDVYICLLRSIHKKKNVYILKQWTLRQLYATITLT